MATGFESDLAALSAFEELGATLATVHAATEDCAARPDASRIAMRNAAREAAADHRAELAEALQASTLITEPTRASLTAALDSIRAQLDQLAASQGLVDDLRDKIAQRDTRDESEREEDVEVSDEAALTAQAAVLGGHRDDLFLDAINWELDPCAERECDLWDQERVVRGAVTAFEDQVYESDLEHDEMGAAMDIILDTHRQLDSTVARILDVMGHGTEDHS